MAIEIDAVVAPLEPVAEIGDVGLVLTSVEFWTNAVWLQIVAFPGVDSLVAEREWRREMERWASMRASSKRVDLTRAALPHHPGDQLGAVEFELSDDIGTRYERRHSASGGTRSEWRLSLRFQPGVPRSARRLSVSVDRPTSASRRGVEITLPSRPTRDLLAAFADFRKSASDAGP